MNIRCLFFAESKQICGTGSQAFTVPEGTTLKQFGHILLQTHPQLSHIISSCFFAVNEEYVEPDSAQILAAGDEIAVVPPLSGG